MAKLGVYPIFKVFTSAELVNSEGSVNVYSTGTTTNVASYYDADNITLQKNPLQLDSEGETNLYLTDDQKYTLVIDDISSTTNALEGIAPSYKLESNLDVNGQSIVSSTNGDIVITTGSGGQTSLDGLIYPNSDGNSGQALLTDGAGNLSFGTPSALLDDTTPQLGGNLDANGFNILFDSTTGIQDESGNYQIKFTTSSNAINYISLTNSVTTSGPTIAAAGGDDNIDLNIKGKGTGKVILSGYKLPINDGTTNQVLITNGAGALSFSQPETLVQRVYTTFSDYQSYNYSSSNSWAADDTIPQSTEGVELASLSITPQNATSRIRVEFILPVWTGNANTTGASVALFRNTSTDASAVVSCSFSVSGGTAGPFKPLVLKYEESPNSTNEITFTIRGCSLGDSLSRFSLFGALLGSSRVFGGIAKAYLLAEEIQ